MKSLFDDGETPPTLSERLSGIFSGAFTRPTRPTLASKTRRLEEKGRRGAIKPLRGKAGPE